jgi:hypothetical protein
MAELILTGILGTIFIPSGIYIHSKIKETNNNIEKNYYDLIHYLKLVHLDINNHSQINTFSELTQFKMLFKKIIKKKIKKHKFNQLIITDKHTFEEIYYEYNTK